MFLLNSKCTALQVAFQLLVFSFICLFSFSCLEAKINTVPLNGTTRMKINNLVVFFLATDESSSKKNVRSVNAAQQDSVKF